MVRIGWCAVVLAFLTLTIAGCGGGSPRRTSTPVQAAPSTSQPLSPAAPPPTATVLPSSTSGPMSCTVYEAGFATQVIFASRTFDVRAECRSWAGNRIGEGYLWGYQPSGAAAEPADSTEVCYLVDPERIVAARVVLANGFRQLTPAQAASGSSACKALRAFGWKRGAVRHGRS